MWLSGSVIVVWGLSCSEAGGILVPTKDQTFIPCIARWILNHWTAREVPNFFFLILKIKKENKDTGKVEGSF